MSILSLLESSGSDDSQESLIELHVSSDNITLVSQEGDKFFISKIDAKRSGYLKAMIESSVDFQEKGQKEFFLPNIRSQVLSLIIKYFQCAQDYEDFKTKDFNFDIPPEILPELLMASSFLQI